MSLFFWPNPTVLERAVKHYGLTDFWQLAGYILPDGRLLDFSEGSGGRVQDHRNVEFLFTKSFEHRTDAMEHFMRLTGAIRFMPENGAFYVLTKPTSEQLRTMRLIASETVPIVEMRREKRAPFYREYEEWDRGEFIRDVIEYWG